MAHTVGGTGLGLPAYPYPDVGGGLGRQDSAPLLVDPDGLTGDLTLGVDGRLGIVHGSNRYRAQVEVLRTSQSASAVAIVAMFANSHADAANNYNQSPLERIP